MSKLMPCVMDLGFRPNPKPCGQVHRRLEEERLIPICISFCADKGIALPCSKQRG
jgi:hypothetical protein